MDSQITPIRVVETQGIKTGLTQHPKDPKDSIQSERGPCFFFNGNSSKKAQGNHFPRSRSQMLDCLKHRYSVAALMSSGTQTKIELNLCTIIVLKALIENAACKRLLANDPPLKPVQPDRLNCKQELP
jgi:hypothetical protein